MRCSPIGFATKFRQRTFDCIELIVFFVTNFVNLAEQQRKSNRYGDLSPLVLPQRRNHDPSIRDVRSIHPNTSRWLISYRMDFPALNPSIKRSRLPSIDRTHQHRMFSNWLRPHSLVEQLPVWNSDRRGTRLVSVVCWWLFRDDLPRIDRTADRLVHRSLLLPFYSKTLDTTYWKFVPVRRSVLFPWSFVFHVTKSSKQNLKEKRREKQSMCEILGMTF